jgi:hypothetical protein
VSEDNPWRQLGTIVNGVLLEARSKAIRSGKMAYSPRPALAVKAAQIAREFPVNKTGNGFLGGDIIPSPARPVQLELPFGIAAASQAVFGTPRAPRGVRLM